MPDDVPTVLTTEPLALGREEESLFARDDNDVLIRREKETRERFQELVTIAIDGYSVEVPRAVPKTDAQGNCLRDADGDLTPRTSTIYDAALRLVSGYRNSQGEEIPPAWTNEDLRARIPVLCHQQHVAPVAVCRMCSVHVSSMKRGKLTPGRKLVPACQHRVETNMVVTTRLGGMRYNPAAKAGTDFKAVERFAGDVNGSLQLLAELLTADHCHPPLTRREVAPGETLAAGQEDGRFDNELVTVATTLLVDPSNPAELKDCVRPRLRRPPELPGRNAPAGGKSRRIPLSLASEGPTESFTNERCRDWETWNADVEAARPYSSRTVVVDHDRCILCDRCVRACSEVKPFKVIGHTGKGYGTRISFDLDSVMGESNCVQCGECMNSCPTGALSLRRRVQPQAWTDSPQQIPLNPHQSFQPGSGFLTADEMQQVWLWYNSPTRGPRVVYPFRSIPYAYLKWNEGSVRRWEIPPGGRQVLCRQGEYASTAFLLQGTGIFEIYDRASSAAVKPGFFARLLGREPQGSEFGSLVRIATGDEFVLGEMACLTHRPRNAAVVAVAEPDSPSLTLGRDENGWPTATADTTTPGPVVVYEITRNMLDMMQRTASARVDLQEMYTFRVIQSSVSASRLFVGLNSEERERAIMLLLIGGAEFRRADAGELIVAEGDPASDFYIVRLGTIRVFTTVGGRERVVRLLSAGDYFGETALLADRPGSRTATVAALDPVELVRVPGPVFRQLCDTFPSLREGLATAPRPVVRGVSEKPTPGILGEYVRQGLYQGQRLLVLDLTSCTRCDECTRACADSHDGNARLLREGLRFGDFLVATSCRSCHKPYCMEGCPVDAIHRKGNNLEVVIENHCIGCGLCEQNCPYGAIHMVPRTEPNPGAASLPGGNPHLTAARRAVNCDLCNGGEPFCVEACPHESAFRTAGPELLDEVLRRMNRTGG